MMVRVSHCAPRGIVQHDVIKLGVVVRHPLRQLGILENPGLTAADWTKVQAASPVSGGTNWSVVVTAPGGNRLYRLR